MTGMNERIALIWFSCFCWASENFSSMPAVLAESWIDFVLAVRQPLSAPTWEKPSTILSLPPLLLPEPAESPSSPPHAASGAARMPAMRTMEIFLSTVHSPQWGVGYYQPSLLALTSTGRSASSRGWVGLLRACCVVEPWSERSGPGWPCASFP
jgi:hypothetical protein